MPRVQQHCHSDRREESVIAPIYKQDEAYKSLYFQILPLVGNDNVIILSTRSHAMRKTADSSVILEKLTHTRSVG
jgi:hypothetical protein